MYSRGVLLLIWVIFIHFTGIYLFLRGFLLTRLSLSHITSCPDGSCTLPPTHKRAIFLIIDALRFDFIAPDPPAYPVSPFHHGVLTVPRELTQRRPHHSFVFNSHADPPTTTLQRIKGLTTGSLPTFVDIGSNFGGAAIDEDSLIEQLRLAGKTIAFMGDDTWTTVFPESFRSNLTFPYDSFNVEDLHTVDEGVITHLLPLLRQNTLNHSPSWDFLIGHFLGVDHVGHRLGPDHPTMHAKLKQMNDVLGDVVDLLDNDTLLVLLGDHGMDRTGDHGGDGVLETSAGVWIYSKSRPLSLPPSTSFFSSSPTPSIPEALLTNTTFPNAPDAFRTIQQIDLVPTLALLLGLPIPFNNLGTIIPELFSDLPRALKINAEQVHRYLTTYRNSTAGGELDGVWADLEHAWSQSKAASNEHERLVALHTYTRLALDGCRALWAQFNIALIVLGLVLLFAGLGAVWALFARLGDADVGANWEAWLGQRLLWGLRGAAGGAVLGIGSYSLFGSASVLEGLDALDCVLFMAPWVSALALMISTALKLSIPSLSMVSVALPLALHTLAFFSNSFTVWEDRIVLFLLVTTLFVPLLRGFAGPTARLRSRILGFSLCAVFCVWLAGQSTVCREEQGPSCHATFFAGATLPSPPILVLIFAFPAALALPWAVRRVLRVSKSDGGIAAMFFPWVLAPATTLGTAYWVLEHAEASGTVDAWWTRSVRTGLARCALAVGVLGGGALWYTLPVCLEVSSSNTGQDKTSDRKENRQVTILGFGNAYGAPYLVFWCIFLSAVWACTQLTGQLILALAVLTLLAHLEAVDSLRDVRALEAAFASSTPSAVLDLDSSAPPATRVRFAEVVPLALLGTHLFFGTGHQASVPSIQWKAAFVLSRSVVYPWSPVTVVLNTFGGQLVLGLAAPLLGMWNVSPISTVPASSANSENPEAESPATRVTRESLRASLGVILYYSALLLGALGSAGALRRHLMVWKVWAPRVGVAVGAWSVVALAVLFGWGFGVRRVIGKGGVGGIMRRLGVGA